VEEKEELDEEELGEFAVAVNVRVSKGGIRISLSSMTSKREMTFGHDPGCSHRIST
jgi:hypothetical protein